MTLAQQIQLQKKYRFSGRLVFMTAFRIGSGRAGESGSDLGVLRDPEGVPVLPGSSLKGKFRSIVERLAYLLQQSACLLDKEVSGVACVSDIDHFRQVNNQLENKNCRQRYEWLTDHQNPQVCDVCRLFGSPLCASRIFFQDARIVEWNTVIERRDGVVIDRDSERAVDGLKYDFEVVPAGTSFDVVIEVENPTDTELALIAIGLSEWQQGMRLGGGVSRGLGLAKLEEPLKIELVDFTDPASLMDYCLQRKMKQVPADEWTNRLKEQLSKAAAAARS